jgi:DNA repair protein RadC
VHPREIFTVPIALRAAAIVIAHNHPSGDSTPSMEDRNVTIRLQEAGELLGISVLDHLVIGAEHYYSFSDGRQYQIGEVRHG